MFDLNQCVFHGVCRKEDCNENCIRFNEFNFLVSRSNLPSNKTNPNNLKLIPEDQDLDAFLQLNDIKTNIVDFVSHGNNLYLYSSNCGNGKTTWAIKMLLKYFNEVWIGNGFRCRGVFVNVPTLMNELRNNISQKNEKIEELKMLLKTVDIVVWDDIGAVNIKEFDHLVLLSYIDQRINENKSNIYTANLSSYNLEKVVGQRLYSRIWNNSYRIELHGADRRYNINGNSTNIK